MRTAGAERSRAEIKRDYEYLMRLWESVRELTLKSTAPTLVYEEADLIKRSIRDLYSRDIDEIIVDSDEGYRAAKNFMKLLIPSHAKRVQPYRDPVIPLFHRYQVESQMDAMHSPVVQLKSGGYIVINPTEALVAIDVNSGRSTRERNIEETALKTNAEAAGEIARQLRLRDLAGLIVIDFIDMEVHRNQTQVERRLKEAMRNDRARIQLGRISPFGLLELSRQRLRPSLFETSFEACPNCAGTGVRRSIESTALYVLRAIEEEGTHQRAAELTVDVPVTVALYILNQKRQALNEIEGRYGFSVMLTGNDTLIPPDFHLVRTRTRKAPPDLKPVVFVEEPEPEEAAEETAAAATDEDGKRRRRRRSRRRKRDDEREPATEATGTEDATPDVEDEAAAAPEAAPEGERDESEEDDENRSKRRRRGKRGGRRRPRKTAEQAAESEAAPGDEAPEAEAEPAAAPVEAAPEPEPQPADAEPAAEAAEEATAEAETEAAPPPEEKPAARKTTRRRTSTKTTTPRTRTRKAKTAEPEATGEPAEAPPQAAEAEAAPTATEEKPAPKPRRRRKPAASKAAEAEPAARPDAPPEPAEEAEPAKPAELAAPPRPIELPPPPSAPAIELPAPPAGQTPPATEEAIADDDAKEAPVSTPVVSVVNGEEKPAKQRRRGWWQRLTS